MHSHVVLDRILRGWHTPSRAIARPKRACWGLTRQTRKEAPKQKLPMQRGAVQFRCPPAWRGIDFCALGAACTRMDRFSGKARIPPPWPNGQGVCLRSRRFTVRIRAGVVFLPSSLSSLWSDEWVSANPLRPAPCNCGPGGRAAPRSAKSSPRP